MLRAVIFAAIGLVAASIGCGSAPQTQSTDNFVTCATETRALPYQAGMSVASDAGVFTVRLLSSLPAIPVRGQNDWSIEVDLTASGAALDDLDITVTPWMPDHLHGTSPVLVTPRGQAGTYELKPVYLYMPGLWQIQFSIVGPHVGSGIIDTAVLPLCIS